MDLDAEVAAALQAEEDALQAQAAQAAQSSASTSGTGKAQQHNSILV